uniref:Calcium-activated neutral proteinase 11 n=1 Tax=Petromyzon marinus TaxID=7757 RepID=S4RRL7_PETMA
RLQGSYEALSGGSTTEGFEDFTGGVAESIELNKPPSNLWRMLQQATLRGSLMGCSINITSQADSEAITSRKLVKGHAYSLTGTTEVDYQGQMVRLVRIRNPWGQVEWTGAWSDNAPQWGYVSDEDRGRLQVSQEDGEFWMSFEDFLRQFSRLEICNLTPDALDDDSLGHWSANNFEGSWVRGCSAGGCRNFIVHLWEKWKFHLKHTEEDDDPHDNEAGCTFIVALMQKERRKKRRQGGDVLTVGYAIYEVPEQFVGQPQVKLKKDYFQYHSSKARSEVFINLREVSQRFTLPAGEYIVVPSTFEPNQEADFILRIFSEKQSVTVSARTTTSNTSPHSPTHTCTYTNTRIPHDGCSHTRERAHSRARTPTPRHSDAPTSFTSFKFSSTCPRFYKLFDRLAGEDQEISAKELQSILNRVVSKLHSTVTTDGFGLEACRSMVSLMDKDGTAKLGVKEFNFLWKKIKNWQQIFLEYDTDSTGTMNSMEMRLALEAAGFRLNEKLNQIVTTRYADGENGITIDFDNYVCCLVRLETMFRTFQALEKDGNEKINLNLPQFLHVTMFA